MGDEVIDNLVIQYVVSQVVLEPAGLLCEIEGDSKQCLSNPSTGWLQVGPLQQGFSYQFLIA